jgi:hypothetical protein
MLKVVWNPSRFLDYRGYWSLSTGIWSLRWLFLYLCSYNLVSSITPPPPPEAVPSSLVATALPTPWSSRSALSALIRDAGTPPFFFTCQPPLTVAPTSLSACPRALQRCEGTSRVGDELEAPNLDEAATFVRRIATVLCRAYPPPRECGKARRWLEVSLFLRLEIRLRCCFLGF